MVDGACRRKGALFSHFMDGRAWRPPWWRAEPSGRRLAVAVRWRTDGLAPPLSAADRKAEFVPCPPSPGTEAPRENSCRFSRIKTVRRFLIPDLQSARPPPAHMSEHRRRHILPSPPQCPCSHRPLSLESLPAAASRFDVQERMLPIMDASRVPSHQHGADASLDALPPITDARCPVADPARRRPARHRFGFRHVWQACCRRCCRCCRRRRHST